jgi:hypothetical protein
VTDADELPPNRTIEKQFREMKSKKVVLTTTYAEKKFGRDMFVLFTTVG